MSTPNTSAILRFDARGVADAGGVVGGGGSGGVSVVVEFGSAGAPFPARVLAVGSAREVDAHEAARSPSLRTILRPGALLLPGMVNAHAHLDLTHIGPRPHNPADGFSPWIAMIRDNRRSSPDAIRESVAKGAELSLKAGVVAVGDIAGAIAGRPSRLAFDALAATDLAGVSFIEFFALGTRESLALASLDQLLADPALRSRMHDPAARVRLGLQPHAPYSVSPGAYLAAGERAGRQLPMCTHLAETPEERLLLTRGEGPLREMLEALGIWSPELGRVFGHAASPVQHVRENALKQVSLVAHVNDASDEDLDVLAESGVSVAYCPRASAYFGAERHFGPHRYRDMLARGTNVALGTDSIVNLPTAAVWDGISILDEMRFLHRRDGADPLTLLQMATTNAAAALGAPKEPFTIRSGQTLAGLVAVPIGEAGGGPDSLRAALVGDQIPELLFHSSNSDMAR